jgi:uncharacterized protein YggE
MIAQMNALTRGLRHLPSRRTIAVVLALVAGALTAGGVMYAQADNPPNGITVTGQGIAVLPPDQAIVNGSVQSEGATATEALNANSQAMAGVVAAVKAFSSKAEVQTSTVGVFPQYSYPAPPQPGQNATPGPPAIIGYQANSSISVKTTDLATLGDLIQTMVNAGLNQFNGVQFTLVDPEQLRLMALQAAIGDAEQQAQTAAAALGVRLGGVLNFTTQFNSAGPVPFATGAPPPPAAPPVRAAAPAPPNIQPGPLSATSSVIVTFAILGPASSEGDGGQ